MAEALSPADRSSLAAEQGPETMGVCAVLVSVRRPGEEGGNRISTVLVDLPTDEADATARLMTINAAMRELKDSAAVRAGALIIGASGWAPPVVSSTLARAMSGVRAFNLVAMRTALDEAIAARFARPRAGNGPTAPTGPAGGENHGGKGHGSSGT